MLKTGTMKKGKNKRSMLTEPVPRVLKSLHNSRSVTSCVSAIKQMTYREAKMAFSNGILFEILSHLGLFWTSIRLFLGKKRIKIRYNIPLR